MFKIGDIVIPIWKGSSPVEVAGFYGLFIICDCGGTTLHYFPSELIKSEELTRDKKLNTIL